ncbi:MAG: energy coupling factor transporter S component ThiW [Bacillota bacterium]|nr:energy coupling factor transporter S component ThiW [Bacillota bacterium]
MNTKRLTLSSLLIAIGAMASHLIYIPAGVAKCYPVQHAINVISAIVLGPWYAGGIAFAISLLRNILGTGSPLAFPGSVLGAVLAGFVYYKTKSRYKAILGEVFGTGILGALVAYPVAKFLLGRDVAALFFVLPFMASTIVGSVIGYVLLSRVDVSTLAKIDLKSSGMMSSDNWK